VDTDGLTFAVATTAEERVAKRLGLTTVRVGIGVANGVPEGELVSFGLAGSLGELRIGDVLDATRVVDETGTTLWEGPGLGVRGARAGVVLGGDALVHDEAERRLLELIRAAGLPAPQTNAIVAGYEVDCYWPRHKLVVEVDGYAFHGSRAAFERDRRKTADLAAAGLTPVRVTWLQIAEETHRLVAQLAQLLPP
jgi:very-short-patch-repair endonuclease